MLDLSVFSGNPAAVAATVAAAVTGAFASLKFYSDKAAKVTDFRKAWIETLRLAVAEFSGSMHTVAGRIKIRNRHDTKGSKAGQDKKSQPESDCLLNEPATPEKSTFDKQFESELLTQWSTLRLSYNKLVLHLNPAEHLAYIQAEAALAAFVKLNPDDTPDTRERVSDFLYSCIDCAERNSAKPAPKPDSRQDFGKAYRSATATDLDLSTSDPFSKERNKIEVLASGAGSCLLLSAFATRQLLHADYDDVLKDIPKIEHGIRVIDTATAVVIKGVWEDIKRGEPGYRRTSWAALLASPIVIVGVVWILLAFPAKSTQSQQFKATCTLPAFSHSPGGTVPANVVPRDTRLSCEAMIVP
ncbi:hypothetical protein [Massilia sp. SYSU DXS3249]